MAKLTEYTQYYMLFVYALRLNVFTPAPSSVGNEQAGTV